LTTASSKILFTSDIHASLTHLHAMLTVAGKERVDAILIGGDIIPHDAPGSASSGILTAQAEYLQHTFIPALEKFRQENTVDIFLDLGNDDYVHNRQLLYEYDGDLLHLLHMQKHRLTASVDVIGYMNVPPTPFYRKDWEKPDRVKRPYAKGNLPVMEGYTSDQGRLIPTILNLKSRDTIESDLNRLSTLVDNPFIFVSHSPPYQTPLDVLYNGIHAGSMAVRAFIKKWGKKGKLIASFHGHIHESPVRSGSIMAEIGSVPSFNPGQGNGKNAAFCYIVAKIVELSSGGYALKVVKSSSVHKRKKRSI
jgi:Icc-related predicted phosphoesterase